MAVEYSLRMIGERVVLNLGHVTPLADLEALTALTKQVAKGRQHLEIVEIGSWVGESAVAIAKSLGSETIIYCIDPWKGNEDDWTSSLAGELGHLELQSAFNYNTRGLLASHLDMTSKEAATGKYFQKRKLDMVFIDAEHTYESVKEDIALWYPKIRPGGLICGHDYCEAFPGVKQAVKEFAKERNSELVSAEVYAGTSVWYAWKKERRG